MHLNVNLRNKPIYVNECTLGNNHKSTCDHGTEAEPRQAERLTSVVGGGHGRVHEPLRRQAGGRHGDHGGGKRLSGLRTAYPLGVL